MQKLTLEQQQTVADNHNLIYGFIHKRNLDVEEWYDLLAIELCISVMKLDTNKASLTTFFYMRCESLLRKEYTKSKRQKNAHNGHVEILDHKHTSLEDDVESLMDINELFDGEFGEILKLKADGFTQQEIANRLGVTQSYISKVINNIRKEYYKNEQLQND